MNAEIPHWIDNNTGAPVLYPNVSNAHELTANATVNWLETYGNTYGWNECTAQQCQNNANFGKPSVVLWRNPTGDSGHVAIVRANTNAAPVTIENGKYKNIFIAQAGAINSNFCEITDGFGSIPANDLRFFIHD